MYKCSLCEYGIVSIICFEIRHVADENKEVTV